MGISTLCDRFTATLEQKTSTKTALGGFTVAWSIEARGSLPTSVRSDMQVMNSEDREEYGIKETDMSWCMYSETDPQLETEDRVSWTDSGSKARLCRVVQPSYDMAGRGRIWLTVIQEKIHWS